MGFWDKVKETAQKAADAAKEQIDREDSVLNKAKQGVEKAADKASLLARDQMNRSDSLVNRAMAKTAATADKVGGALDNIEAGKRDESIEMAKRYSARKKAETNAGFGDEPEVEEPAREERRGPRYPNSQKLTDEELYKAVSDTIYPDFRSLPGGDKRFALCEIARFDKKIVNVMRALGSAWIDTVRQLADGDEGWQAALQAVGLANDRELKRALQNWVDDAYDDAFYADDDGARAKPTRYVGWLLFSRVGGNPGEAGGEVLTTALADAGVTDVYGVGRLLQTARTLVDAREQVILTHFKPRRSQFTSQFLVQRGLNADVDFQWLDENGKVDDGLGGGGGGDTGGDDGGFSGGSLMEL